MNIGSALLIANPAAQRGNGARAAEIARDLLRDWLGDENVGFALTERPGHAAEIAASAPKDRYAAVIALGGDVLAHEVVNGLVRLPRADRPAFGLVPVGSGNDYARTIGMSESVPDAIVQFLDAEMRALDLGCCNGEFFTETLSFGLDAAIALDTVERRKHTNKTEAALYFESGIDQLLHQRMEEMNNPSLATYAKPCEVRLRATAKANSAEAAAAMLTPVVEEVRQALGNVVYGIDVPDLESACFRLLKERGLTFATAESCTCGRIAARITALSGSSAVFRGGVVSYWSEVKANVLGVPQELLDKHGAVSEEVARAMAEGARRITGADLAVSVTGVAGPDSDDRGNPVGLVFIGLATPEGTFCRRMAPARRTRERIQEMASNHAYDVMRRYLTGLPI